MPFCVNCGVRLDANAKTCPLCQTPVWHPEQEEKTDPWFPAQRAVVAPAAPQQGAALLISLMLASAAFCCTLLNLVLSGHGWWSLYVTGAAAMLWVWLALPLLSRKIPGYLRLSADVAAVGVYVWVIALCHDGMHWYVGLALPILVTACLLVFLLAFLLRGGRRSILTSLTLFIGAAAVFLLAVEYFGDLYFHGEWSPGWSLIPTVICAALMIPLIVIRRVPALREEIRRRFALQ